KHPILPLDRTVAMINMDMIGRMERSKLTIGGVGTASEWRELIKKENISEPAVPVPASDRGTWREAYYAGAAKFNLSLNEDGYGPSDHSSFYSKKIPVLFFFTGTHEDYHKPSDTADKINYEGEELVVSFVAGIVRS